MKISIKISLGVFAIALRCKYAGRVIAIGAHNKAPRIERNRSSFSDNSIATYDADIQTKALERFVR